MLGEITRIPDDPAVTRCLLSAIVPCLAPPVGGRPGPYRPSGGCPSFPMTLGR